jgi:cold-inducible RNA-binding protein
MKHPCFTHRAASGRTGCIHRHQPQNLMNTKLYVGNLPFSATALELQGLFAEAGGVAAIDLVFDKVTGRSRGFAFVTMVTTEAAGTAIEKLHGHPLDGRNLTVSEARPPAERPRR